MPRPVHFEIPVDDPDRAEKFYAETFGWSFKRFDGGPQYYGLATTGPDGETGINGALMPRGDLNSTVLTMSVKSIEDALVDIEKGGGKVITGKTPIPNMGYFA